MDKHFPGGNIVSKSYSSAGFSGSTRVFTVSYRADSAAVSTASPSCKICSLSLGAHKLGYDKLQLADEVTSEQDIMS